MPERLVSAANRGLRTTGRIFLRCHSGAEPTGPNWWFGPDIVCIALYITHARPVRAFGVAAHDLRMIPEKWLPVFRQDHAPQVEHHDRAIEQRVGYAPAQAVVSRLAPRRARNGFDRRPLCRCSYRQVR